MSDIAKLDLIREFAFGPSKPSDSDQQKNNGSTNANQERGRLRHWRTRQQTPPEPIDDRHHGVQRIQDSPGLGNDHGAESNWRDVETQLYGKRQHVPEVSILNVKCRKVHADP